jgi:endogenous inhibitor of DNA gyrase (YacG/DUF329 family)
MMQKECPICRTPFEEKEMEEHLMSQHKASLDPELEAVHHTTSHHCVQCGADLPSPEALKDHNAQNHRM